MTLEEVQGLSRAFAPVVADAIKDATTPLIARIAELEKRPTAEDVERAVRAAVEAMPKPVDGKDGRDGVDGKDGEKGDPGRDAEPVAFEDVIRAVDQALAPQDGRLDPVAAQVQRWLEANPPKDGVDGKDGRDGVDGKDGDPGRDGADGQKGADGNDGIGLAGAVIDRAGSLIVTLTDGSTRELGPVVGRDGVDGKNGERGERGFSLEHFDTEIRDGGRTLLLKFQQGEVLETHEIGLDVAIYRGVFKAEQNYERGDMVTYGGSLWHCNSPTAEPPKEGDKAWTLAAKRGRDGKDGAAGKDGERGAPGQKGDPGRDGKSWG